MEYFLQQLINSLTLGSIYGLIAIGYTMVYGIIGMINFAHGDVFMIGSFVSLIAMVILGVGTGAFLPLALLVVLFAAILITSAYGWTLERVAYRPLRGSIFSFSSFNHSSWCINFFAKLCSSIPRC